MSGVSAWIVAGLVLGVAELIAPGYFLLWIGIACVGTGAIEAASGLSLQGQLGVFAVLALALVALAGWRLRRRPNPDLVNAPSANLIGASCTALAFRAGEGRVSLRDGAWSARLDDGSTPPEGTMLRVVGIEGTTLVVSRA